MSTFHQLCVPSTYYYLRKNAVILRLDVHLCLVCLDLEEHISGSEGIACSGQPWLCLTRSPSHIMCVAHHQPVARPWFGFVVPSLIFQVAMLPSVIVGESAGMLKFCAASEAWPA